MSMPNETKQLVLNGVDHTAHPTWKLSETVAFYRDVLGLKLIHAVTAKGWGRVDEEHADFLHFFFDSGQGSMIAFFFYIGTDQPENLIVPRGYMSLANHTAWKVESEEKLLAWQKKLEDAGVKVSQFIAHEIIESIYFRDPNGYPLEITRALRDIEELDAVDAELTIEAALQIDKNTGWTNIEQFWRTKAELVRQRQSAAQKVPAE